MASFDYRLNPLYTIKECSSCGALYTTYYCCSKGGLVDKIVRDPNKTSESSQQPPQNCARCGNPVDGPYCRGCALLRKKFKEDLFTYCVENGIFQDLQDTSESSNDNTNVVNAPQEPFVVKQDPGENSSQSPPHIDHNCCYECGDSLDGIFCQRCTCKSCGKGSHQKEEDKHIAEDQATKDRYWKIPICYDDDDDEESSIPLKDIIISGLPPCVAITPVLSIEEPVDSLIMEDEHLDSISATESDEVIKSSVENLVETPSESEGILDKMCDVPFRDNSLPLDISKDQFDGFSDSNDDSTSIDDDSFSIDNTRFCGHHLPFLNEFVGELTLLKSIPPGIDDDNLDPEGKIHLVKRLLYDNSSPRPSEVLNVENSIDSFSPSPIPVEDSDSLMEEIDLFLTLDDSMPPGIENDDYDSEGDILFLEEFLRNDSPSLPENESFHFDIPSSPRPPVKPPDDGIYFKPDTGLLTTKVVGDISEHYFLMPKLFSTQPTLCQVNDTLIPFLSENEDKVHLLSHRGFKAFHLFSESPIMIYGGDIPLLDVPFLHFYLP
ncbi:hypothetical protein Tco_0921638 [Tanacetum coccineum]